jgi:hypothetical protein
MFGPSLRDGSGTMASADPCGLNVGSGYIDGVAVK